MGGLADNFALAIRLAAVVALATAAWAAATGANRRRSGLPVAPAVARVLAAGAAAVAFVATSVRGDRLTFERGGDLVLTPGGAGLGDLGELWSDPTSLAAVLLVANVALYVPVAFFAVVGWYRSRHLVLPGCLALSVTVEAVQYLALGRVAALDDVVLNVLGAAAGYLLGRAALRAGLARSEPVVTTPGA